MRMMSRLIVLFALMSLLAACGGGLNETITANVVNAPSASSSANTVLPSHEAYKLGAGDKLRIIVFGEEDLSGEFVVDDSGAIGMPLIGDVMAQGLGVSEFEDKVIASLKNGYLRDPKVSIEVLNYRPFFILGEVKAGENILINQV
jgi:protein involved in polysaccharide export with SLBB domain